MFRYHSEPAVLNEATRQMAPGQFVKLSDGYTHYEIAGPDQAETIVLVHGFSVPYYVWDPTFPALVQAGFRVLRYDLFGRGYSDRPATRYDYDLYDRQLQELLTALNIIPPVHLIGLSMGGAIVVTFTARHPAQVAKLCLIDPAGLPTALPSGARWLKIPILAEFMLDVWGENLLASTLKDDFHKVERFTDYQNAYRMYRAQMQYRGFRHALVSTLRSDVLTGATEAYAAVGTQERPVMLIWGQEDATIPFETHRKVQAIIPQVEFYPIEDAGHIPHYERPEIVNSLLIQFLQKPTRHNNLSTKAGAAK